MRVVLSIVTFLVVLEGVLLLNVLLTREYPRRVCIQREHDAARLFYALILINLLIFAILIDKG